MRADSMAKIYSFWWDSIGLHIVPLLMLGLLFLQSSTLNITGSSDIIFFIFFIKFLDWGHIFAQWVRIRTNPVEEQGTFRRFLILWCAFFGAFVILVNVTDLKVLHMALIYFVIFHFMKQQYGYMRYLSRSEYHAYPSMQRLEDLYFYVGVIAPVLAWHVQAPEAMQGSYWITHFFHASWLAPLSQCVWIAYGLLAIAYWSLQAQLLWRRGIVPLPKYFALLFAHLGWGAISLFPQYGMLYWLGVVLYHDLSYFIFIWLIGRRDHFLQQKGPVGWLSWKSPLGLVAYVFGISLLADVFISFKLAVVNGNYLGGFYVRLVPSMLRQDLRLLIESFVVQFDRAWIAKLGWALFFSIQAHHYFIDRYLWRKEKDLAWQMRRRKS